MESTGPLSGHLLASCAPFDAFDLRPVVTLFFATFDHLLPATDKPVEKHSSLVEKRPRQSSFISHRHFYGPTCEGKIGCDWPAALGMPELSVV